MGRFQRKKVSKKQSSAGVYRVPDSVQFDQVQITNVPEPVPVHLWLDHTITSNEQPNSSSSKYAKTIT